MIAESRSWQVSAVLLLAIFWAVNWPAMKIGLSVVEPWTFRALLVVVGGLGCLAIAAASGDQVLPARADLRSLAWFTVFQGVLWNAFTGFGISLVEASRAAVLAFTMPIFATLFSMIFLREAVTLRRVAGLAIGMVALALLLTPALEAVGTRLLGTGLMVASAMVWGVSTVIVKGTGWRRSPLTICGWQFLLAAPVLVAAAMTLGEPGTLLEIDRATGAAIVYSALIPMTFCQAVWFAMVRRLPTALASMTTLLVPPLGVIAANLMLGEVIGRLEIAALLLVILALALVLPGFNWRASLHPPRASRPG